MKCYMTLNMELAALVLVLFKWLRIIEGYQFINCYDTSSGGLWSFQLFLYKETTIACMTACTESHFRYTATQYSTTVYNNREFQCYCGNDIIQAPIIVPEIDCGIPCPLSASDTCGRYNRLAVFLIEGESLPITLQNIFQEETTTDHIYRADIAGLTSSTSDEVQSTKQGTSTNRLTSSEIVRAQPATTVGSLVAQNMNNSCTCPCTAVSSKWDFLLNTSYTLEELRILLTDHLTELKNEVAIDKSHTLLSVNKKRCMKDDRPSSTVMGVFGAVMVCIPLVLIVISDIGGLFCR